MDAYFYRCGKELRGDVLYSNPLRVRCRCGKAHVLGVLKVPDAGEVADTFENEWIRQTTPLRHGH